METRALLASADGVLITPKSGLVTSEDGQTAQFSVVLKSRPEQDVFLTMQSDKPNEGNIAGGDIIFTPDNWNVPLTFTISGVPDNIKEGSKSYKIVTSNTSSGDPRYNNLKVDDVSVKNLNSKAAINVTPVKGLVTNEFGGTATFSVVLTVQPTQDVTIPIASSNANEGVTMAGDNPLTALVFTKDNWDIPQSVLVKGVDDGIFDKNISYQVITGAAVSADVRYNGLNPADVKVVNQGRPVDLSDFDGQYIGMVKQGKNLIADLAFQVQDAVITVTAPVSSTGSLNFVAGKTTADGTVTITQGPFLGAVFKGKFTTVKNTSAITVKGTWKLGNVSGTWEAQRTGELE